MKISTKGIYALEMVVDLAIYADDGNRASIRSVAVRRKLSEKYLEQIITMLKRADYVKSLRGAQGGYRLAKAPKKYTGGGRRLLSCAASRGYYSAGGAAGSRGKPGSGRMPDPGYGLWYRLW